MDITYSEVRSAESSAAEFGIETLNFADLDLFFEIYSPSQVGKRPTFVSIDGGKPVCDRFREVEAYL